VAHYFAWIANFCHFATSVCQTGIYGRPISQFSFI
jgi:hypothetical protein